MTTPLRPFLLICVLACPVLWCADVPETDKQLSEKEVPAAVLKTMQTAAAGAKLGEYESEKKGGKDVFTATFHDQKSVEQEVTVAPDGTLISVAKEDDEPGQHDQQETKPVELKPMEVKTNDAK